MPLKGEAMKAYQREWMAKRRQDALQRMGGECVKCGSCDDLEVDHIDPTQKVSHRIYSWSIERMDKELEKCQLLCKVCHLDKTRSDMGWGIKHGTKNGYVRYGCRCDDCKYANNHAQNLWRWRTGRRKQRVAA